MSLLVTNRVHLVLQVLQNTRNYLSKNYKQVPQLSVGGRYDLDQPVRF